MDKESWSRPLPAPGQMSVDYEVRVDWLGLGLHERPVISRLNSYRDPVEIKSGMVFAVETYCPAGDGYSAARIEEEVVVTHDGPIVITKYPADDLVVANPY